jgi:hypothetical protein
MSLGLWNSLRPPFTLALAFLEMLTEAPRTGAGLYAHLLNLSFSFAWELVSNRMTMRSNAAR